jgi:hypothetical protein
MQFATRILTQAMPSTISKTLITTITPRSCPPSGSCQADIIRLDPGALSEISTRPHRLQTSPRSSNGASTAAARRALKSFSSLRPFHIEHRAAIAAPTLADGFMRLDISEPLLDWDLI